MRQLVFLAITLNGIIAAAPLSACENAVRDAGFRGPRDTHHLCLITATDDEAARTERDRLENWLKGPAAGLNIELVHLRADDPEVDWQKHGIPSAPPTLPVVALIGKNYGTSEHFVINVWEPAPSDEQLADVLNSPARRRLQETLGPSMAVIVYAPGEDFDQERFDGIVAAVKAAWLMDELKTLPPIEVVKIDRDDERERTLVSFMGLAPDGPSMAGVVFGRGKLMSPPLLGPEITRKRINELIDQIYQDCNCSKPLPSIGVDLPLVWNEDLAKTFVPVSDPTEKEADPRLEQLPGLANFSEAETETAKEQAPASSPEPAEEFVINTTRTDSNQTLRITLATLVGVGVAVLGVTLVLFLKRG